MAVSVIRISWVLIVSHHGRDMTSIQDIYFLPTHSWTQKIFLNLEEVHCVSITDVKLSCSEFHYCVFQLELLNPFIQLPSPATSFCIFFFPLVNFYQVCFFQVSEVFSGPWMPKSSVIQESQSCSASQVTTGLHHGDCLFITGPGHLIWIRFLPRVASAQNDDGICCLIGMFWDMLMNVL